jgi:plasmid rolling circle replication initiator protein Rep
MPDSTGHNTPYLSEISPKHKSWDKRRSQTADLSIGYAKIGFNRLSERTYRCSPSLLFGIEKQDSGETKLKLLGARFCKVRHCATCQERRSVIWRARFLAAMPKIAAAHPTGRWLFLTLTVRNCQLYELRSTLKEMNRGWVRMIERKSFPALGYVKSVEVTRGADGSAHPHFHCLLLVPSSYFTHGYISQAKWTELWRDALRVEYQPIVNVKAVKPKKGEDQESALSAAVVETLKYSIKPEDLTADPLWLGEITRQLHKSRAISVGGVLKKFIRHTEPEDLVNEEPDADILQISGKLVADWHEADRKYRKRND